MLKRVSPLSLVIALLALVIAMSGTAVAVTNGVQITDAIIPTRAARVDAAGRLSTSPAQSTINASFYVVTGDNFMTQPTTATLALTRINLMNTANNASLADTNFLVVLAKYTVGADGQCGSGSSGGTVSVNRLAVGEDRQLLFPSPLLFKPTAGQKYCLDLHLYGESGTPGAYYLPFAQIDAWVVAGSYPVSSGSPLLHSKAPLATATTPRPAGTSPIR